MTSPSPDNIIDVAIIGGGVSGAYTAYRLMNTDPSESPVLQEILEQSGKDKLDVRLIEMGNRIGGRLWSINVPGLPNLPAEMGGMSFSQLQRNVYGLCTEELGLDTKRSDLFSRNNLQYFRGQHFWGQDYDPPVDPTHLRNDYYPNVVPFFLEDDEKLHHPGELLAKVFDNIAFFEEMMWLINKPLEDLSIKDPNSINEIVSACNNMVHFLRNAKLKSNSPLYKYGFWNILVNSLSPDACNLIQTATTWRSLYGNWNFYDFCLMIMRLEIFNRTYRELTAGYDALPITLVDKFKEMGGVVNMETKLIDLNYESYNGEQLIKLTVGSSTKPLTTDLYARYVVLALPQRALKLLFDRESTIFGKEQSDLLDTVTAYPAYKLILAYDEPWWEQIKSPTRFDELAHIRSGFSLTDLPLQTCYYVGKESTQHSLLIASAGDGIVESFWSDLRPNAESNSWLNSEPYVDPKSKIVTEAQQQLKKLHNINNSTDFSIPDPVAGLFWNWQDDPFGGAWHLWNPGVKSWEVGLKMSQPNPEFNVFLCGEAYSQQQGWVEGALNSAEVVLKDHFKLPRPSWVPDTYRFDL